MPEKYVPKHRSAPPRRVRKSAKNAVYASGVAFFATGLSVSSGLASNGAPDDGTTVNLTAGETQLTQADLAAREQSLSRSSADRREATNSIRAAAFSDDAGAAKVKSVDLTVADPQALTRALMPLYGLSSAQFGCIDSIWSQESNWNVHADNPHSSAYGIPQALPGSKMSSAGPNWQDNAETQIRWGLNYIKNRYGSACAAWSFKQSHGWY